MTVHQINSATLPRLVFFSVAAVFLLAGKILALNATDTIQAEAFSGQSGVSAEVCAEGGQNVTAIQNGDHIYFANVDFGSSAVQCFEARVAGYGNGGFIELRLDSETGTLVGTCEILPPTGGWQIWTNKACQVTGVTGVKTLYLVFKEGPGKYPISNLFNLNWFKFHGTPVLNTANWRQTTNAAKGVRKTSITLTDASGSNPVIQINPDSMYQRIDGWGGAFNENGYHCISSLSAGMRQAVMRELYDPVSGCRFNMGRVPIGMSDFTVNKVYSLNETADDYAMNNFSLHNDSLMNIAYVKAAQAVNPNVMIYGSPWTPPGWMKTNNSWEGGGSPTIKQNAQIYTAYALYFSKFVKGWQKAGIPINVVFPQNEPGWCDKNHPSCSWTGAGLKNWVRDYLYPKFVADSIGTQIWMGTYFSSNYAGDLQPTLDDPQARTMMTGIGTQRFAEAALATATQNSYYRSLHYHSMQTETMCYDGLNNWDNAMGTYERIYAYELANCQSYNMWNMILDANYNYVSWMTRAQNSLITIEPATQKVTYNPEFYVMKHWSYYIRVGAVRVHSTNSNSDLRAVAFKNPDGTIILEVQNKGTGTVSPRIRLGAKEFTPEIAGSSVNTFNIGGVEPDGNWVPATGVSYRQPAERIAAAEKEIAGVYDIMGRLVMVPDRQTAAKGADAVRWNRTGATGGKAATGLYLVKHRIAGATIVRKEVCR